MSKLILNLRPGNSRAANLWLKPVLLNHFLFNEPQSDVKKQLFPPQTTEERHRQTQDFIDQPITLSLLLRPRDVIPRLITLLAGGIFRVVVKEQVQPTYLRLL